MERVGDSVPGMIRPVWRGDDEQRKLLVELIADGRELGEQEERFWAKVQAARRADIPDTVLEDQVERISKSTMNRKLGPRPKG